MHTYLYSGEPALQRDLAPILVRANVPAKLRSLRLLISELEEFQDENPTQWTMVQAIKLQALKRKLEELKREHILLVVDNTCP